MKKSYLLSILVFQLGFAQAPAIEWQKSLGGTGSDQAYSIQQTNDGGYIVAGATNSNDGDVTGNHVSGDCWIVKLNSTGSIQWQKAIGGTGEDYITSIQQTTDGGYIVACYTTSNNGDVTGNHGNADCWVVKLNSTGTIQWQKALGGTDYDYPNSIQETTDGGYIVAGETSSNNGNVTGNHGISDNWVVKLNSAGTIQWQKALGGTADENAASIQQSSDGGYIVAGYTASNNGDVIGNHGYEDYWVVKLTSTGSIEWQKTLGGTGSDEAKSIQQTADGGYIVAGITSSFDGDVTGYHGGNGYDAWIVKLNSTGTIQWQKAMGGTGEDYITSIQQTTDGGYIVAGYTFSFDGDVTGNHGHCDYWVIKFDIAGTVLWQKALGGTGFDFAFSIQQTTDGGYIIAGITDSNNYDVNGNHGTTDCWVVKLGSDLGTDTFSANTIKTFPNPTSSIITVQGGDNLVFDKMIVTDLTGKTVLLHEQGSNQINVEQLSCGMYLLQAFSGEEQFMSKFVKE